MLAKVLIICAVAAATLAVKYPPGVHPAVCPNYPFCDNELLARFTPEGMPIPEWEVPMLIPLIPTDKYPAGINPLLCPNYPYCDHKLLARFAHEKTPSAADKAPAA